MKRVILTAFIVLFTAFSATANDAYRLEFDKNNYKLLYSEKMPEHSGYINEYFKQGESRTYWTEIVNVIHFPNSYSPLDHAEEFSKYLNSMNCPNAIKLDEKNNYALMDFILIDGQKLPIILEFNVFKFEKHQECGTIAIQYVKRYRVYSTKQVEKIKKDFNKLRPKMLKEVEEFEIPEIEKQNIDEIKLNDLP